MKTDRDLSDVCIRMRYVGEIDSSLTSLMVEYRDIELSTKLPLVGKQQLLKCLDVSIAILQKALARYAREAVKHWQDYEAKTSGVQSNNTVDSTSPTPA